MMRKLGLSTGALLLAALTWVALPETAQAQRHGRGGWGGYHYGTWNGYHGWNGYGSGRGNSWGGYYPGWGVGISLGAPYGGYYGSYSNPYYSSYSYPYYSGTYEGYYGPTSYSSAATSGSSEYGVTGTDYMTMGQGPTLDDCAHVAIHIPTDRAEVWIEGKKIMQDSRFQDYRSPPLEAGHTYTYDIRARWIKDGKQYEVTRSFPIQAGEEVVLNFSPKGAVVKDIRESTTGAAEEESERPLDRDRMRDIDRDKVRDIDRDRVKDTDRDRGRVGDTERNRDRDTDRDRDRVKDKDSDRDRTKDSSSKERDRDSDKNRDNREKDSNK